MGRKKGSGMHTETIPTKFDKSELLEQMGKELRATIKLGQHLK